MTEIGRNATRPLVMISERRATRAKFPAPHASYTVSKWGHTPRKSTRGSVGRGKRTKWALKFASDGSDGPPHQPGKSAWFGIVARLNARRRSLAQAPALAVRRGPLALEQVRLEEGG